MGELSGLILRDSKTHISTQALAAYPSVQISRLLLSFFRLATMSEIIEMLQKVGLGILGFLALFCLYDFINFNILYPRSAKNRKCASPKTKYTFPLGIPTALRAIYFFLKHDVNEFLRRDFFDSMVHTWRANFVGVTGILTDDPENIKTFLATSFKDYSLGWRYNIFFPVLGNGIFTLSGEGWKHSRAMLRPQFARDQITHLESINHHVGKLIDIMKDNFKKDKISDFQVLLHQLTIDTATEFLFGESVDSLTDSNRKIVAPSGKSITGAQFVEAFNYCQDVLALRFLCGGVFWLIDSFKFRYKAKVCKDFIDYFVAKALDKPMEKDEVAESYIFMKELTKETRDPVVIRDQALNILLAGRDTTASVMSFMAVYMAKYPEVYQKLREAVAADFGNDTSNITFESLKRCKYLNNVLNEVLRLHPVVAFNFRQAVRDTTLPRGGGPKGDQPVFVPANTILAYSPYSMQRSADFWGPDADEFNPDRWDTPRGHGWEYLPFNGGPRICLGQQFALTEMAVTWVRICQAFEKIDMDTSKVGDYKHPKLHHRLTISVSGGVPCKLVPASR